jgi:hypothetical protein
MSLDEVNILLPLGIGICGKLLWNVQVSRRILSGKELGAFCWSGLSRSGASQTSISIVRLIFDFHCAPYLEKSGKSFGSVSC